MVSAPGTESSFATQLQVSIDMSAPMGGSSSHLFLVLSLALAMPAPKYPKRCGWGTGGFVDSQRTCSVQFPAWLTDDATGGRSNRFALSPDTGVPILRRHY